MSRLDKIQFCRRITSGLPSFLSLLWNSKRLRWSKSGNARQFDLSKEYSLNLDLNGQCRAFNFRTYTGDTDIFYEIFYKQVYALPAEVFNTATCIVDLGANTGIASLYFQSKAPGASIICVEPDKDNFAMLQRNLIPDNNDNSIKCLQAAISGEDRFLNFSSNPVKYNSRLGEGPDSYQVQAMSMPSLFKMYGLQKVDILKMDIEGAEHDVFSGNLDCLNVVDHILIEIHQSSDVEPILTALRIHGFAIKQLDADPANQQLFHAYKC